MTHIAEDTSPAMITRTMDLALSMRHFKADNVALGSITLANAKTATVEKRPRSKTQ